MQSNEALITSLHQIGAIQFGEFLLKSGQTSSIYLNLRKIISYPTILTTIAEKMWQAAKEWEFERVCGVPYTALPIATCISVMHNVPMVMRRKEKKDYGTKQMIEGDFNTNDACLIIEDVITTGGSVIETALELQNVGLRTPYAIVLIDRSMRDEKTLRFPSEQHEPIQLRSILTIHEVLETLLENQHVSQVEKKVINQFLEARTVS